MIQVQLILCFLLGLIPAFLSFSAPGQMFSGHYMGATVDYQRMEEKVSSDTAFTGTIRTKQKFAPGVGLLIGSNFVQGQFVYGMSADIGFYNSITNLSFSSGGNTYNAQGKLSCLGHLKMKIGYASESILPYLSLGLALGQFLHQEKPHNIADRDLAVGASLGAGIEFATSQTLHVFGEANYDIMPTLAGGLGQSAFFAKPNIATFKVGVIYKLADVRPPLSVPRQAPIPTFYQPLQPTEIRFRSVG